MQPRPCSLAKPHSVYLAGRHSNKNAIRFPISQNPPCKPYRFSQKPMGFAGMAAAAWQNPIVFTSRAPNQHSPNSMFNRRVTLTQKRYKVIPSHRPARQTLIGFLFRTQNYPANYYRFSQPSRKPHTKKSALRRFLL